MSDGARALTYCTNIHPGEGWNDVRHNLEAHALPVKARVSPEAPFPLGLRISSRAAEELDSREIARFRDWCDEHGFWVPTLNGFPYGDFHGTSVKAAVYRPDWRTPERAAYTRRLADILAEWLPADATGSISTAPVAFGLEFDEYDATAWLAVRRELLATLEHLDRIRQQTGRRIVLAFEPEPCCVLETTEQAIAFFERMALPDNLRDLAGVCFDCCHQAVEFESPRASLQALAAAWIPIGKVQVTSSLRATGEEIDALAGFDEPTYLHQVVTRLADGNLRRFSDLPDFFANRPADAIECRVHFHVPVFAEHLGPCATTRPFLEEILPLLDADVLLEVETYSWDVLPPDLRKGSVIDSIAHELEWTRAQIAAGGAEHG